MRIVLTSFGTLGDIHPLIAVALELQRRGHIPVLAVPELFRPKIVSLGLEFAPVGPILDPEDNQLVAMLMDIRKGTERTLREILFPAIRQSYRELLAVVEANGGADLMLAGELVYQAPIVAEVTGIPWASHVLAPLSFFSRYDAPVSAAVSHAGTTAASAARNGKSDRPVRAVGNAELARADLSVAFGTGAGPRSGSYLRSQALSISGPSHVLAFVG